MNKNKIKKYKNLYNLNKFINIKQKNKQIYLYRYNNLTIKELFLLKKKLKEKNFFLIKIKKKLITTKYKTGQGSNLIIFNKNYNNLLSNLFLEKKLQLIYLNYFNNFFFNKKINNIFFFFKKKKINNNLINNFLVFLHYLREIKNKAYIT